VPKLRPHKRHKQVLWRLEPLPKSASNNLRKWFLSPTGLLNLGIITEGRFTAMLIIPSSWGFLTGPVRHHPSGGPVRPLHPTGHCLHIFPSSMSTPMLHGTVVPPPTPHVSLSSKKSPIRQSTPSLLEPVCSFPIQRPSRHAPSLSSARASRQQGLRWCNLGAAPRGQDTIWPRRRRRPRAPPSIFHARRRRKSPLTEPGRHRPFLGPVKHRPELGW
jgi:hypothetical protein